MREASRRPHPAGRPLCPAMPAARCHFRNGMDATYGTGRSRTRPGPDQLTPPAMLEAPMAHSGPRPNRFAVPAPSGDHLQ